MDNGGNRLKYIEIIVLCISGLSVFLYLLYVVGKTYYDTYLLAIGIPSGTLSYGIQDYAFIGVHWDNLIITLVFTGLLILFLHFLFPEENKIQEPLHLPNGVNADKKPRIMDVLYALIYQVLFAVVLVYTAFLIFFSPAQVYEPGFIIAGFIGFLSAGWSLLILWKNDVMLNWIRRRSSLKFLFIITIVVILIYFPSISAKAKAAFEAAVIPYQTYKVELSASYPLIPNIKWGATTDNQSVTSEPLLMLFNDEKCYVLRSMEKSDNATYILNRQDVQSVKILGYEYIDASNIFIHEK